MKNQFIFDMEPFDAYLEFDEDEEKEPEACSEFDEEWDKEVNRLSPDYIRWIQDSLNKILGVRLTEGGVMGRQTRSAIRTFQQRRGLKADGIVGTQTERALIAAGASTPPGTALSTPLPSNLMKPEEPPGYTLYGNISLGSESPAKPMTGIFIPKSYIPRSQVDLIIYLHGHKTTRVCGPGDETSIDRYWRSRYWPLREKINESRKNVILIMPTLGPQSQPGRLIERGGLDWYLDRVLALLSQHKLFAQVQQPPKVRNIILGCHSGGGNPMLKLAKYKGGGGYGDQIVECWGFDCLYANKPDDPEKERKQAWLAGEWARWARFHRDAKLYIYYLGSTKGTSEKLKAEKLSNLFVEKSTALNHCQVPITHWERRVREARFLADV
jgi:Putative peptidoglycan binding domain